MIDFQRGAGIQNRLAATFADNSLYAQKRAGM